MASTPYLAPTYFAPAYFPPSYEGGTAGGSGASSTATGGRYLAPDYFAPTYWGSTGAALPVSFLAAVRSALRADPALSAAVSGGFWNRQIPPGVPDPVFRFTVPSSSNGTADGSGHYIQAGQLQVDAFANEAAQARTLADRGAAVLTDAEMAWVNGRLMYLRPSSVASIVPPARAASGRMVYSEIRLFDYAFQSSYAAT